MASLRTIGWMACLIYATIPSFWLVIHRRAHDWRSRPRYPYPHAGSALRFVWVAICGRFSRPGGPSRDNGAIAGLSIRARPPGIFVRCWPGALGTGLAVLFALTAFARLTGLVMIRLEDQELQTGFGAEYAQQRERGPAVLPRIGR